MFLLLLESPQLSLINAETIHQESHGFNATMREEIHGFELDWHRPDERHAFDRGQIDHLGAVPVFTASFNWSAASLIEISGRK